MSMDEEPGSSQPVGQGMRLFKAYKEGKCDTAILHTPKSTVLHSVSKTTVATYGNVPSSSSTSHHINERTDSNPPSGVTARVATNVPAISTRGGSSNNLLVSSKQRGNPVLQFISNVAWEFRDDVVPDYVLGRNVCAFFLSLRYHNLNPDYIHDRLKSLGSNYELRVLLVQVDVKDPHHPLKELSKLCFTANLSLVLAWSPEEAARYLETYKAYENKPPDTIQQQRPELSDSVGQSAAFLTSVRSVNKTDVLSLLNKFKSVKRIMEADEEALSACPGMGPQKVKQLIKACNMPFLKDNAA